MRCNNEEYSIHCRGDTELVGFLVAIPLEFSGLSSRMDHSHHHPCWSSSPTPTRLFDVIHDFGLGGPDAVSHKAPATAHQKTHGHDGPGQVPQQGIHLATILVVMELQNGKNAHNRPHHHEKIGDAQNPFGQGRALAGTDPTKGALQCRCCRVQIIIRVAACRNRAFHGLAEEMEMEERRCEIRNHSVPLPNEPRRTHVPR